MGVMIAHNKDKTYYGYLEGHRPMPNITLSVDEEIIKKVRKIAVDKNTTLTAMVRDYLKSVAESDRPVRERALMDLNASFKKLGRDMGRRTWKRDDLYER
ncbi:MAG: hypothetical protein A2Y86_07765 [Candidatus Aminicenantes bacterium RBG_13_62_12]|nr:MAG: hypothetical protein A2Y86_07765 [Candidatus Aminicenantes bacterium RBG_13_62_12]